MTLQKPSIVLFDMDGTTVRHMNPRLLVFLEKLDDISFKAIDLFSKCFRLKRIKPPMAGIVNRERKPRLLVHKAIHKFRRKSVEQIVEPCPEIYPLLEFLHRRGIPMALVSNGLGKGYGHDVLETFDLSRYFRAILFREDIRKSKPHPDPILRAVRALDIGTGESDVIWYIGDRGKDVKAAIAAQAHLTGMIQPLAYGINAAVSVLEHGLGPEHIIMNYDDLRTRLHGLFGKSGKNAERNDHAAESMHMHDSEQRLKTGRRTESAREPCDSGESAPART